MTVKDAVQFKNSMQVTARFLEACSLKGFFAVYILGQD